jgi:D-ribulokinase
VNRREVTDLGKIYIGIDVGTSGCRATAIDAERRVRAESRVALPPPRVRGPAVDQDPTVWWEGVYRVLSDLLTSVPAREVAAIAVDGTSGTVLLTDANGKPVGPALMYNDTRARPAAERVGNTAPAESAVHGATSALAKVLYLQQAFGHRRPQYALSQADWIAGTLTGRFGLSDDNNCLKLGFDPVTRTWPAWLEGLGLDSALLPEVHRPGTPLGTVGSVARSAFGLPPGTLVAAGTTDSTAAILATGAQHPGEGITSLGSTLVVKVVSATPLFAPRYGVYSQPFGAFWLAGGGSNSGGAVLRHYFDDCEIEQLSGSIPADRKSGLDYYPLLAPGERFPVNDPDLPPRLVPRPTDPVRFLHGLLEGIARIEAQGYSRLRELGAPVLLCVRSVGAGARNTAWRTIRQALIGVPLVAAKHAEAAYGAAMLARSAHLGRTSESEPSPRSERKNPQRS